MSTVSSPTDIFNWALDLLSEAEIQSPTENNPAARACNRQWPKTRTVVLASCIWRCSKDTKALSNSAAPADKPGYSFQSVKPGDLISPIDMWDGDPDNVSTNPIPTKRWDEEGDYILHSLEYPSLEYVFDNTNVSTYTPKMAEAMAYHLAGAIGRKVTGSDERAAKIREEFIKDKLPEAQMAEGIQKWSKRLNLNRRLKHSPLLRSRVTSSVFGGRDD